jgi:hypothetical protein
MAHTPKSWRESRKVYGTCRATELEQRASGVVPEQHELALSFVRLMSSSTAWSSGVFASLYGFLLFTPQAWVGSLQSNLLLAWVLYRNNAIL